MSRLKRLIQEIHRRSLWQVLGIYLVGAWVAFQGIEALVSGLGLPEWVPGLTVAILIAGLPIVLATAFVQEGVGAGEVPAEAPVLCEAEAAGLHLVLTWKNVILGGVLVIALAGIGVAVALYTSTGTRAPTGPPITAIAVLPFDDMSPAGDQRWLADGLAEDLIDSLSRIEELRVIARTSAFAHRGEDIAAIGEGLQVGTVVEGSLRRSGDQLRVTAQLIRVADSSHLWSANYNRELSDVFAIQGEIARAIAEAIRAELGVQDTWSWLTQSRYSTPDVRAWELVKKAVAREATWTEEGFRDEISLTLQALEIDPEYAQAHAQHGWGYYYLWDFGHDPREENLSKAKTSAESALELDPTNGSAHNLLGWLSLGDCDWAGAEARFARALKATPSHGPLRQGYGSVLFYTGRVEEAAPQFQRAVDLDPEMVWFRNSLGLLHLARGNYIEAIGEFQRGGLVSLESLVYAHHLNGDDERAAEVVVESAP